MDIEYWIRNRVGNLQRRSFEAWTRSRLQLPFWNQTVDVCNELATNFSNQNAIKSLSKLSVSESASIAFSSVWKVLRLFSILPDKNATPEMYFLPIIGLQTYLRTKSVFKRG